MANGTPANDGRDPRTNVMKGCTDATEAPLARRGCNTSLLRTPLECSATFPFPSNRLAREAAACAVAVSGTQIHKRRACTPSTRESTRDPILAANDLARASDAARP